MPRLNADRIYLDGNGRLHCGRVACAGATAALTGTDLHGATVVAITNAAALAWTERTGAAPACESCGAVAMLAPEVDGPTLTLPVTITHVRREMDGPGKGPGAAIACTSPSGRRTWCTHTYTIEGLVMGPTGRDEHDSEHAARAAIAARVAEVNRSQGARESRLRVTIRTAARWISWPEGL